MQKKRRSVLLDYTPFQNELIRLASFGRIPADCSSSSFEEQAVLAQHDCHPHC
jgi:hypothetical protein